MLKRKLNFAASALEETADKYLCGFYFLIKLITCALQTTLKLLNYDVLFLFCVFSTIIKSVCERRIMTTICLVELNVIRD